MRRPPSLTPARPLEGGGLSPGLELLGDRWCLLILQSALGGVSTYEGFIKALGMARNVLAGRLRLLVAGGILARTPDLEREARHRYVLTAAGQDFAPVIALAQQWSGLHFPVGPETIQTPGSDL